MTSVKYSSCGMFGITPRFNGRSSERMRLLERTTPVSSKDWETVNRQEAVSLTFEKKTSYVHQFWQVKSIDFHWFYKVCHALVALRLGAENIEIPFKTNGNLLILTSQNRWTWDRFFKY